jgi:hypothetical protein
MAGITHGYKALKDQLEKYFGELEAAKDGEKVSSDPIGAWYRAAMELTGEIMDKVGTYMKKETEEKDNPLVPLRRAMEGIADLGEAIAKLEKEPSKDRLRLLGRGLSGAKGNLMLLGRALMLSQELTLAAGAHELAAEVIQVGQQQVRAALQRIGAASDILDAGSVDLPGPRTQPTVGGMP